MWMLINLSKEYRATIDLIIEYQNPPSGKVLFNEKNDTLHTEILASGGRILARSLRNAIVKVDLDEVLLTNNNTNFWLPNRSLTILRNQLKVKDVIRVQQDTMHLIIDELEKRRVPIVSKVNVKASQGFKIEKIEWGQDSVIIEGPRSLVKEIQFIETEEVVLKNKRDDFTKNIELKYPPKIKGIEKVKYSILFEKYTEKELVSKVKLLNVPTSVKVQTVPEEVNIKFDVGYSKFNSIKSADFEVVCDLNTVSDTLTYLPLRLKEQPDGVENIRLNPTNIKIVLISK